MTRRSAEDRLALSHRSETIPVSPRTPRPFSALIPLLALLIAAFLPALACAADGIPLCAAAHDQSGTVSAADGLGGTYVGWVDARLGYNTDIVLTHVDRDLVRTSGWVVGGNNITSITCQKTDLAMLADTSGAWLAWGDARCIAGEGFDIYTARVTKTGKLAAGFPANGLAVQFALGDQVNTAIAPDAAGGIFVAWTDQFTSPARLLMHHVLPNGTVDPLWPVGGQLVAATVPDSTRASLASDGAGGVFVAWQDMRGVNPDVMIARLAGNGTTASGWPAGGVPLCTATGSQFAPQILADGSGGVHAAWMDRRGGPARVYAKHLDASGAPTAGWPLDGRTIAPPPNGDQARVRMLRDAAGGDFYVWQDTRIVGVPAVYAQHLDVSGVAVSGWPVDGLRACNGVGAEVTPELAADGQGGIVVTWLDSRRGLPVTRDLYAQRLAADGALPALWAAGGTPVCDAGGERSDIAITTDALGRACVAWSDSRALASQGMDIAAAIVDLSGPAGTHVSAVQAIQHDGQTFLTWSPPAGTGWTYRIYSAPHAIATSLDLEDATLLGAVGDSSATDKRLSSLLGQTITYATDSLATPLDPARGLFVYTPASTGERYYQVSAQNGLFAEDRTVAPGSTATDSPVSETVAMARPVYQRTLTVQGISMPVWTTFVSAHATPFVQAMANREGLAFDHGIVRPATQFGATSLLIPLHHRGGNFLESYAGTHTPGEYVLALDDYLPNTAQTFWYGYSSAVDERATLTGPVTTGTVVDYTVRRELYCMDWALRTFNIDPGRVFVYGYSMGGVGTTNLLFHHGSRFAAGISNVGNIDLSFTSDPDTACQFGPNGSLRKEIEKLWGTLAMNLPTVAGRGIYDELNETARAADPTQPELPPVLTFVGKRDSVMGWALNLPFYTAMNNARRGGAFFWEDAAHEPATTPLWQPQRDPRLLYRYRNDRSYPAISNCSTDDDPGDGVYNHGAMLGTIHGYVQWDSLLTDTPLRWSVGLQLKSLQLQDRVLAPPDSATMDVTPRRLQHFALSPGNEIIYLVVRNSDNAFIQIGSVTVAADGTVTIPAVRVYPAGVKLSLASTVSTGVGGALTPLRPGITFARTPARGPTAFRIVWPAYGSARADLYDVSGRAVRSLYRGAASAAPTSLTLETANLAPGLYMVGAEVAGRRVSGRIVVLR